MNEKVLHSLRCNSTPEKMRMNLKYLDDRISHYQEIIDELVMDKENIIKEQIDRRESLLSIVNKIAEDDIEELREDYYRKRTRVSKTCDCMCG
jgi:hypothetical protein